jgi:C-terminal processing protease CtpA/Prc
MMMDRRLPRRVAFAAGLSLLLAACSSPTEVPDTYEGRFEQLWQRFDVTYPYFIHKGIDWNASRAAYLPRASAASSQTELVEVVAAMLAELHDVHLWLVRPDGTQLSTYTSSRARNWDRATWLEYTQRFGYQSTSSWGWARVGTVGYITIGDWNPSRVSAEALDGALESLRGSTALVIDVRMNGGGNDQIALAFAGRFATRGVVTEYFRFRDGPGHGDFGAPIERTLTPRGPWTFTAPVLVLSGRGALSSNESFVAAMRELPNVTIVGDTTGGGSANPALYPLGDGWQYSVSRWIATTVDGVVIEDNGIPPVVAIPFRAADFERRVDVTLDSALVLARKAGGG